MDFVIDTSGSNAIDKETTNSSGHLVSQLLKEYKESLPEDRNKPETIEKSENLKMKAFFDEMGWTGEKQKSKQRINVLNELHKPKNDVEQVLKKSVITSEFEKAHTAPPFEVSEKLLKKQRKKEAELTKGNKWYGLPATEITEEVKRDLEVLQMRSALDPKRFYKKNDLKVLPKYFQVGKVLDSPLDYYNSRLTKKERKKTLVDELLADAEFTQYNKRKYKEIMVEKQKTHYRAWRQAKKLKKKK